MTKARQLQRALYVAAKGSTRRRFHALYDKVYREDILARAWAKVKANQGAAGVGQTLADIEARGASRFLAEISAELRAHRYRPRPARRVFIPKPGPVPNCKAGYCRNLSGGVMAIRSTALPQVVVIEPDVYSDGRGFFLETYSRRRYEELGINAEFVQDNHSHSRRGVLRGLHYQNMSAPMAKLVRCSSGAVLDVAVDLRVGSPTFGRWHAVELTAANARQLLVPVGFGHAFLVLSETADVQYKCSGYYNAAAEGVIAWDDPEIGIDWPEKHPVLSPRDANAMSLREYLRKPAFHYVGTAA